MRLNYGLTERLSKQELDLYQEDLVLLEGAITEFVSCMDMMRNHLVDKGQRDPILSYFARIKSAESMKCKLEKQGFPVTAYSALNAVYDAAGVRLICPLVDDIYRVAEMIHGISDMEVVNDKDYIKNPKPNGYRSYHMILRMNQRFIGGLRSCYLEVQIRTIGMDCWASIEHQLKYKHDIRNSELIVDELKRCSDEIMSTDLSLQTIRDLIEAG